jgi:hypothetical protein
VAIIAAFAVPHGLQEVQDHFFIFWLLFVPYHWCFAELVYGQLSGLFNTINELSGSDG